MRARHRELVPESVQTPPFQAPDPRSPEASPTSCDPPSSDARVHDMRARVVAGEFQIPAMLVAERMIAQALSRSCDVLPDSDGAV